MASKSSTRKAKGRKLQQAVAKSFLGLFPSLTEDDVQSRGMGQSGTDIMLSQAAKELIQWDIECKNQERMSLWDSLKQCEQNNKDKNRKGLLVFKRNRSEIYACMKFDDLLELMESNKNDG